MSVILWFKNDLRIRDNAALYEAIQSKEIIISLYCFSKSQFEINAFGFRKTGVFRAQFLLESLKDLDTQLRILGSGLLVKYGIAEEIIPELVKTYGVSKVITSSEVGLDEIAQINHLNKQLKSVNCDLQLTNDNALLDLKDFSMEVNQVSDIFTNFRHQVEKKWIIREGYPSIEKFKSIDLPELKLPELSELGFDELNFDERSVLEFKGGESEGLKRVAYYFEQTRLVSTYKQTRNGLIGGDYSSKFSPWLAMGCISARTIYHKLKAYELMHGDNESTYWLIFELLWRDYFRIMMRKYPSQFFLKKGLGKYPVNLHVKNDIKFEQWINGKTDNEFINSNMLELKYTGFMSNRGRQNVASYLCHNLKCDWRYGAAYFEEMLIDYDVSSNWCNWAYLAGVGNDPIKNRVFNPEKQAQQYDGDGAFRRLWL